MESFSVGPLSANTDRQLPFSERVVSFQWGWGEDELMPRKSHTVCMRPPYLPMSWGVHKNRASVGPGMQSQPREMTRHVSKQTATSCLFSPYPPSNSTGFKPCKVRNCFHLKTRWRWTLHCNQTEWEEEWNQAMPCPRSGPLQLSRVHFNT